MLQSDSEDGIVCKRYDVVAGLTAHRVRIASHDQVASIPVRDFPWDSNWRPLGTSLWPWANAPFFLSFPPSLIILDWTRLLVPSSAI